MPLVGLHLGSLHLPEPLLSEIREAPREEIALLGITILEPSMDQMGLAATKGGPLSFNDYLCLLMAKDLGHTCITNDKALLKACSENGVPTVRGLRLLLNLVAARALTKGRAINVGRQIQAVNPHHIHSDILETFKSKLDDL